MNKISTLLLSLIVLNFVGCASEYSLSKPHGKWVPINQNEAKVNSVESKSITSNTVNSK